MGEVSMDDLKKGSKCHKFIESLEIIYSLFLAVGLSNLLLNPNFSLFYGTSLIICGFTLIRFFFAPSKNIEFLVNKIRESELEEEKKDNGYRLTLLIDTPILFIHAILFTMMCKFAQQDNMRYVQFFYTSFFLLLVVNFGWLKSICYRVKKFGSSCENNISFWAKNNISFAIPIGIIIFLILPTVQVFVKKDWFMAIEYSCLGILFILGLLNCIRDLKNTYKIYLFHD